MKNEKLKIKNLLAVALITLVVGLSLPARTYAIWPFDLFSKSGSTESQTKFPTVIQRTIDRFKLNSGEVEKVVEEVQTERRQEMRARREARLEEAVKAGIITSEQKKNLLEKEDEWQQKQGQLMEERRKWMTESGIDFRKLAPYMMGFGGRGFGRGFHMGRF